MLPIFFQFGLAPRPPPWATAGPGVIRHNFLPTWTSGAV
jgi:hypothetical protein